MKKYILILFCTLPLISCMSREQTDAKILEGCKAGIEFFLDDGYSIKDVKKASFKNSSEFGNGFREVNVSALISDGWVDLDKNYKCVFAEEQDFLKSSYRATLYQINIDDQSYGVKGNFITGDAETLMNLEDAVNNAMR